MTETLTPPANTDLLTALQDRINQGDDYARQLEEAVRTWESLDQSPQSLLDQNDTVLITETPSNLPWPGRPAMPVAEPAFAEILGVLPDAIVLLDDEGRVKFWNKAAESAFGWMAFEVIGMPPPFLTPVQMVDHREILAAARWESPIRERTVTRRTKDHRLRSFTLFTSRTPSGEVAMAFRAVEPKPEAITPPPSSVRMIALGQMVASVSHDFNNVLTAIVGSADMLAERTAVHAPNREWIEVIRTAGKHAMGLTRRLLQFAKSSATTAPESDLSAAVEELLPLLKALVPAGVRVKAQLEPNLPLAMMDATALEQVILNLTTNGGQAMPRGGVLQLRTSEKLVNGKRFVVLAVADSGAGMDDVTRARLFEPYFTTKGDGAGLGLATVRDLVSQAGGTIELDTMPGLGSAFRIFLPAKATNANSVDGTGKVALVVDDDPASREVIKRVLESVGFDVSEAGSGDEALQVAKWLPGDVDLLIADVVMPGLGGRKLAERLRVDHPDLAVLFVSGYPQSDAEAAFLSKPFLSRQLLALVRAQLAKA